MVMEKKDKIYTKNIIKSKMMRPDFLIKMIVCMILFGIALLNSVDIIKSIYPAEGSEYGNMLMYLIQVFTNEDIAYYSVLLAFAILVSDIIYEQYLTKNIYVMYGSRRNVFWGMLKLIASFSIIFLGLFLLMALIVGISSGIDVSFEFTKESIRQWAQEQEFYIIRSTSIYIPVSVLKYNAFLVLGIIIFKYYVGLILLAMVGLIFSIKKDNVQYGAVAILLTLLVNIALLQYYGPWNFYNIGVSIDLSEVFGYLTLQRFFIYDWAGRTKDVLALFGETMFTGGVWFLVLSIIIYRILKKKDI